MDQTGTRAGRYLPRQDGAAGRGEVAPRLVALVAPASEASEQYRALHLRLERARTGEGLGMLALVSATEGEGTTITAANLAVTAACAQPERRVLLVELNARAPGLAAALGIPPRPGVAEVIAGDAGLGEAARRFHGTPLSVLCMGTPPEDAAAWLGSQGMRALLSGLRANFDDVLLDLPPVLRCAATARVAGQAEGTVLVASARRARAPEVRRALELLEGLRVLGCVLNDVAPGAER
jgi:Mrp family chromosome partitioning ATPase